MKFSTVMTLLLGIVSIPCCSALTICEPSDEKTSSLPTSSKGNEQSNWYSDTCHNISTQEHFNHTACETTNNGSIPENVNSSFWGGPNNPRNSAIVERPSLVLSFLVATFSSLFVMCRLPSTAERRATYLRRTVVVIAASAALVYITSVLPAIDAEAYQIRHHNEATLGQREVEMLPILSSSIPQEQFNTSARNTKASRSTLVEVNSKHGCHQNCTRTSGAIDVHPARNLLISSFLATTLSSLLTMCGLFFQIFDVERHATLLKRIILVTIAATAILIYVKALPAIGAEAQDIHHDSKATLDQREAYTLPPLSSSAPHELRQAAVSVPTALSSISNTHTQLKSHHTYNDSSLCPTSFQPHLKAPRRST